MAEAADVRFAAHPWVLGQAACAKQFGLSDAECEDPTFDFLGKLGFSAAEIAAANGYCCGGTAPDKILGLQPEHRALVACLDSAGMGGLSPVAVLRMAAAMQPFTDGLVSLHRWPCRLWRPKLMSGRCARPQWKSDEEFYPAARGCASAACRPA